jgi:hypothetical protein
MIHLTNFPLVKSISNYLLADAYFFARLFFFPDSRNAVNIVEKIAALRALPERTIIGLALEPNCLALAALNRTGREAITHRAIPLV